MRHVRPSASAARLAHVTATSAAFMTSQHPRWAVIIAASLALGSCGIYGDFNRLNPPLAHDNTHAWIGPAAAPSKVSSLWQHQLTDNEQRLRDLAYPLIEPPYDRNQWYSALAEWGGASRPYPYPDRAGYASRLFQTAYRSQTARYNKLIEDIRNDVTRLEPFFSAARYVTDMDRKREKALAYVSNLTQEEQVNTTQRIRENRNIVDWVQGALIERAAAYKVALERLVIAAPSQSAVEAERALALLQQRMSSYGV
jgi:hypothetical protein